VSITPRILITILLTIIALLIVYWLGTAFGWFAYNVGVEV
jgi:hypothetical protein